jgi:hypothetical protein
MLGKQRPGKPPARLKISKCKLKKQEIMLPDVKEKVEILDNTCTP